MRKNLRVAVLGTGMLSLLVAGVAWAAESRLEAFAARVQGLDAAGRRQVVKALTKAERTELHMEYRALSAEAKKAFRAPFQRAQKGGGGAQRGTVGTVQYDTGTPHGFRDDWGSVVGNRFNTGFGNPHTISLVTFHLNGTFSPAGTQVRVYGPPAGTVAPVLAGTTFGGTPNTGSSFFVWNLPDIVGQNGSFLAGVEQSGSFSTINSTFIGIDVDIVNGGQGFHGMNIQLGGSGFNANPTVFPGNPYNTIIRATGPNLPVELMNFDVQ